MSWGSKFYQRRNSLTYYDTDSEQTGFVHLHLHTEYSLIDSLIRIQPLMDETKKRGMQALAITDFCNLFALVKFYKAAIASGIKPILGAEIEIYDDEDKHHNLVLLCQNEIGYLNLTKLISQIYQHGQMKGKLKAKKSWLIENKEGLLALSGGRLGNIGQALIAGDNDLAEKMAIEWQELFPNKFYLEIQRTGRFNEELYNTKLVKLADKCNLPLVATNDVKFLNFDDYDAHEARVCIQEGYTLSDIKREKKYSHFQYLRSASEMVGLFKDLPQAIKNTIEISIRCTVKLNLKDNFLPKFPTPKSDKVEEYLSLAATNGLNQRLKTLFSGIDYTKIRKKYDERLQVELEVINSMGFASYFLIVADFIQWAKSNGVPVGPGRGSGAGSLVAYCLLITDLYPLKYELLFERFLNPE